jgi:HNH endonuclease
MRKLKKPTDLPVDVFLLCVGAVEDSALKARLVSIEPSIKAAAVAFENAASTSALHKIKEGKDIAGIVTKDEMSKLYTSKLAKNGAPGRVVYDRLIAVPVNGVCPLCGQRTVSTLDHHLPKSKFPALAVTPSNLIPACADCNKAKFNSRPATEEEQTIHPYFDDFGKDGWLHAEVAESAPPALLFSVRPPMHWSKVWGERARHHLSVFKLEKLYASHAGLELVNIRHHLVTLFDRTGANGIRDHLAEQAASREMAHPNSWQTAMYKALSANAWFCAGGFAKIPV